MLNFSMSSVCGWRISAACACVVCVLFAVCGMQVLGNASGPGFVNANLGGGHMYEVTIEEWSVNPRGEEATYQGRIVMEARVREFRSGNRLVFQNVTVEGWGVTSSDESMAKREAVEKALRAATVSLDDSGSAERGGNTAYSSLLRRAFLVRLPKEKREVGVTWDVRDENEADRARHELEVPVALSKSMVAGSIRRKSVDHGQVGGNESVAKVVSVGMNRRMGISRVAYVLPNDRLLGSVLRIVRRSRSRPDMGSKDNAEQRGSMSTTIVEVWGKGGDD